MAHLQIAGNAGITSDQCSIIIRQNHFAFEQYLTDHGTEKLDSILYTVFMQCQQVAQTTLPEAKKAELFQIVQHSGQSLMKHAENVKA